jgi:hypothetical protein
MRAQDFPLAMKLFRGLTSKKIFFSTLFFDVVFIRARHDLQPECRPPLCIEHPPYPTRKSRDLRSTSLFSTRHLIYLRTPLLLFLAGISTRSSGCVTFMPLHIQHLLMRIADRFRSACSLLAPFFFFFFFIDAQAACRHARLRVIIL